MSQFPVIVPKVWGNELWIVNESEYCCKILRLYKGAVGSLHYHPVKKESFLVIFGEILLEYGDKKVKLPVGTPAITIPPGVPHRFTGLKQSEILEISTHHDDNDVIRLELSKGCTGYDN